MGQQQLLLIVLGVIIVGIAIVVGINVFTANAIEFKRDNITMDCITLGTLAQQYRKKPTAMGGGGNSFNSWNIPTILQTNANGSFRIESNTGDEVVIIGTGNEVVTGNDSVQVSVRITPTEYFTTIIH